MDNTKKIKSPYHLFISERISEIVTEKNVTREAAYKIARGEWKLKKMDKGKTYKKR